MPLYSFKKEFAFKVEEGTKRQTVRAKRANATKIGDVLHLWCEQRSPDGWKIGESVCTEIEDIRITSEFEVIINDDFLAASEILEFAKADGFETVDEFMAFFSDQLPFNGDVIHWGDLIEYDYYIQDNPRQDNKTWRNRMHFEIAAIAIYSFKKFQNASKYPCRLHKVLKKIDTKINLCDTCVHNIAECLPGDDIKFGDNVGGDNVIKCSNHTK